MPPSRRSSIADQWTPAPRRSRHSEESSLSWWGAFAEDTLAKLFDRQVRRLLPLLRMLDLASRFGEAGRVLFGASARATLALQLAGLLAPLQTDPLRRSKTDPPGGYVIGG
jgi:hypothetical protein